MANNGAMPEMKCQTCGKNGDWDGVSPLRCEECGGTLGHGWVTGTADVDTQNAKSFPPEDGDATRLKMNADIYKAQSNVPALGGMISTNLPPGDGFAEPRAGAYCMFPDCRERIWNLNRRIEKYREIIFFYGGHKDDCPRGRAPTTSTKCLCGYDARMEDAL